MNASVKWLKPSMNNFSVFIASLPVASLMASEHELRKFKTTFLKVRQTSSPNMRVE